MDLCNEVLETIKIDIVGSILLYSLLFYVLKLFFRKRTILSEVDEKVIRWITDVSLFCWVVSIIVLCVRCFFVKEELYLIPKLFSYTTCFGIPNLLRIQFIKRFLLTRVLVGMFVIVNIFSVGAVLAAYQSYQAWSIASGIPVENTMHPFSNLDINISVWQLVVGSLLKITILLISAYTYDLICVKIKKINLKRYA